MSIASLGAWFRRSVVVVAALVAVAACGPTLGADGPPPRSGSTPAVSEVAGPGTQVGVPDPDDIDPARLEPLAGLPDCPSPPASADGADPGDVPLPPDAVVMSTSLEGSLRNVQGYSPRTPVEIMVAYLRAEEVTAVNVEDEVFESEVLLERGDLRIFVKSQATCARGSAFVLFASEDEALVPRPANAPTPAS